MTEITFFSAFVAGVLTFFAPCTFATLPIFISYLINQSTGINLEDGKNHKIKILVGALLYSVSFLLVFVILGYSASSLGRVLGTNKILFTKIGSLLIMLFGIFMLVGDKFKALQFMFSEKKIEIKSTNTKRGFLFAIVLGVTTAFAWSPCIGPSLGAVLTLASISSESPLYGALLLLIYGLGIQLPFIGVALTLSKSKNLLRKINKYTGIINKVTSVLLIVLGFLLLTDMFSYLFNVVHELYVILGYQPL